MSDRTLNRKEVSLLPVLHGFFTRHGGVSLPPYDSLNGGGGTADNPQHISENRRRMALSLGVEVTHFLGLTQVHGNKVVTVREGEALWSALSSPEADALVTNRTDIALGIATADCAPVLLAAHDGKIVGAAHAGWRGAVCGLVEQTVQSMKTLGAQELVGVVGPCIGPESYEIGADMREVVLTQHAGAGDFFRPAHRKAHYFFDLAGFCLWRLKEAGVSVVEHLAIDTLKDECFFSYRRNSLAQAGPTGRHVSAIRACLRD